MSIDDMETEPTVISEEFGKYSWIRPALAMAGIGASIYGLFLILPQLLEIIQAVFLFLMFFGMLS